jgi:preprotein translocase subunit YajC
MKGENQIVQIMQLLEAGAKVVHNGGDHCTIDGRKFSTKHLRIATQLRFTMREAKREKKKETEPK